MHRGSLKEGGIMSQLIRLGALAALTSLFHPSFAQEDPCPIPRPNELREDPDLDYLIETDEYWLEIEDATGAQGDVVGVSFLLHSRFSREGFPYLFLAVSHDPEVAEIVGEPIYTDELLSLLAPAQSLIFAPVDAGEGRGDRGFGFLQYIHFHPAGYYARFPSEEPLALMTVFYRLRGAAGAAGALRFSTGELARSALRCNYTLLHLATNEDIAGFDFISTRNQDGRLAVREGPPTHTERPPTPPEAEVYPELPGLEEVNFLVRIAGATAAPGARAVPVEVYVSAGVEYTGVIVPIDFDERYLRVGRAEDHFLAGTTLVDNRDESPGASDEEGSVVVVSAIGIARRRIAAAGEEFHAATLYFDVLDAAAETSHTTLEVRPVVQPSGFRHEPLVTVRHRLADGVVTDEEAQSEVGPIVLSEALLGFGAQVESSRGDVNADGELNLTDAVAFLNGLFFGTQVACLEAGDFNDDDRRNVSDAVALLNFLFLGGPGASGGAAVCGAN
jgi:hypothetical protein